MRNLEEFQFHGNWLGLFPDHFHSMTNLKLINLDGNPIMGIGRVPDLPHDCTISLIGCKAREAEIDYVLKKMRNKKIGEGPTIVFSIALRVSDRPEGGSPDDPPPSRPAPQVVLEADGQTFKSGMLITLKPGEPPVLENF